MFHSARTKVLIFLQAPRYGIRYFGVDVALGACLSVADNGSTPCESGGTSGVYCVLSAYLRVLLTDALCTKKPALQQG
jgi:hypothetical protein